MDIRIKSKNTLRTKSSKDKRGVSCDVFIKLDHNKVVVDWLIISVK